MKKILSFILVLAFVGVIGAGVTLTALGIYDARSSGGPTDDFTVNVSARLAGTEDGWVKELSAPAGSEVELKLDYANISNKVQLGVSVQAELPEGLTYLENSTYLKNASFPEGTYVEQNSIAVEGLGIGSYTGTLDDNTPGATAIIRLTVTIPEDAVIGSTLTPVLKVSVSDHVNFDNVTITVAEKPIDPTSSITQRPAEDLLDTESEDFAAETDSETEAENTEDAANSENSNASGNTGLI